MNSFSFLVLLSGIAAISAYPDGAPDGTCTNGLVPSGHDVEAQNSPSPYELVIDRKSVPVKLTLKSKDGSPFKGFLIHARQNDLSGPLIGAFKVDESVAQFIDCDKTYPTAAVTHKNADPKTELHLTWSGPDGTDPGFVKFPYTVVQEKVKFWVHTSNLN